MHNKLITSDVTAEAVEAVKFLWKRKNFKKETENGSKLGSI